MPKKTEQLEEHFNRIRGGSKTPRGEGITLTYKCNNNCVFCYDHEKRKQVTDMPLEQAKSEVLRLKNKGQKVISLRGSEPTIYAHLLELLQFIKDQGLKFRLTTNARVFYYEDFTKTLTSMGLVSVYTSLHSYLPEVHDNLTRAPESFTQTSTGIKNLLKYGVEVETNTTIVKQNVNHLKDVAQFFSEEFKNLYKARFSFLYHRGVGVNLKIWSRLMPTLSETREHITEAMDTFRKNKIYSFIEKLPVCGAPKYCKDFKPEDYVIRANKKPAKCFSCKYYHNDYCVGISPIYLKLYGEKDLMPLQDLV